MEANTVACILYTNLLTVHRSQISPVSEMKVKVIVVEALHEPITRGNRLYCSCARQAYDARKTQNSTNNRYCNLKLMTQPVKLDIILQHFIVPEQRSILLDN